MLLPGPMDGADDSVPSAAAGEDVSAYAQRVQVFECIMFMLVFECIMFMLVFECIMFMLLFG